MIIFSTIIGWLIYGFKLYTKVSIITSLVIGGITFRFSSYIASIFYLLSGLVNYTKKIKRLYVYLFLLADVLFLITCFIIFFRNLHFHYGIVQVLYLIPLVYLILYIAIFIKPATKYINLGLYLIIITQLIHLFLTESILNSTVISGFPMMLIIVLYKIHTIEYKQTTLQD